MEILSAAALSHDSRGYWEWTRIPVLPDFVLAKNGRKKIHHQNRPTGSPVGSGGIFILFSLLKKPGEPVKTFYADRSLKKHHGPGRIRTGDLRRVRATS
jgi:hypothetical protein